MQLQSKLPEVGTTIFSVMSALAVQEQAINLSQGFPDFDCHPDLVELVGKHMREGKNQYAPMPGAMQLREKIAEKTLRCYGAIYNPETEITITSGATEALFAAIHAVVRHGDEVIIFEPAYDSYAPAVSLAGGIVVPVQLRYPGYEIDWNLVAQLCNDRTRLMILNSPQNPTGAVLRERDIKALEHLAMRFGFFIVSDEVYEHIIFDGRPHLSLSASKALKERTFVISSFGKTFHVTGWKMGYCVAPTVLSTEFRKVHQFLTFSSFTPVQYALAAFLDRGDMYDALPAFYQAKRDYLLSKIKDSRFRFTPAEGTYFQLLYFGHLDSSTDIEYTRQLTRKNKIATIPVSAFYHDRLDEKVIRVCFAKKEDTLKKAAEILCRI